MKVKELLKILIYFMYFTIYIVFRIHPRTDISNLFSVLQKPFCIFQINEWVIRVLTTMNMNSEDEICNVFKTLVHNM